MESASKNFRSRFGNLDFLPFSRPFNETVNQFTLPLSNRCFDLDLHPIEYYQPCEKIFYEAQAMKAEYEAQGLVYYDGQNLPNCSPDGFFGKVQHRSAFF